jgi:hypothetical protein
MSGLSQPQTRYLAVLTGVLFAGGTVPAVAAAASSSGAASDALPGPWSEAMAERLSVCGPSLEALRFPQAVPGPIQERGSTITQDFRTSADFFEVCEFYADRLFADDVPLLPLQSRLRSSGEGWRIEPAGKDAVHRAALYHFRNGCRIGVYVTHSLHSDYTHIHLRCDIAA